MVNNKKTAILSWVALSLLLKYAINIKQQYGESKKIQEEPNFSEM